MHIEYIKKTANEIQLPPKKKKKQRFVNMRLLLSSFWIQIHNFDISFRSGLTPTNICFPNDICLEKYLFNFKHGKNWLPV